MKQILIIEDDIVMQFLLRNLFTDAGHAVNSIMDGKDLAKHKDLKSADLIILDMMIPHVYDSSSLIELYKDNDTPIIVVSSIDEEDGLYFCKKIEAQAFFSKPFDSGKLLNKVDFLLETHKKKAVTSN
jgi:DNA-binding response OmpR family regulator